MTPHAKNGNEFLPNELVAASRRSGHLIDFDPDTPEVQVVLERSADQILLTVPWGAPSSPYARWFDIDDPSADDQEKASRELPRQLLFSDSHGAVLLVGCSAEGSHSNWFGPGTGTISAKAAVLNVWENVAFDRPHGLQTEISGLRDWLGIKSWALTVREIEGASKAEFGSLNLPDLEIGTFGEMTLGLSPTWGFAHLNGGNEIVLRHDVRPRSASPRGTPWAKHLELHSALRELLVLSRWRRESCVAVQALRNDDRSEDPDHAEKTQWRTVIVGDDVREPAAGGYRPHLVKYQELGTDGIARWIKLREDFARALDPVVTSIDLDATPNTLLAHTGPGLEALGYLLLKRDGISNSKAKDSTLAERFERILMDVGDVLPFDGARWKDATARTYNGLKHANRSAPAPVDSANAWRECVLVTRAWVALELGVPREAVTERLQGDPQRHAYVGRP